VDILSDTLAAMRTGPPISTRTDARAPWSVRFPAVAGAAFHVVLRGTCALIPAEGDTLWLGPGDLVFLRRGCMHVLCSDPATPPVLFNPSRLNDSSPITCLVMDGPGAQTSWLCGAYQLETGRPHPLLSQLPNVIHLPNAPGRYPALCSAIEQLSGELEQPRPGSDSIVGALIDLLLLYTLRAWQDEQPGQERASWAAALADPAVGEALRAIHADPGAAWTVESLGRRAGLSRAAFARRFTALVGEPPLTYLTMWRMTLAARLLRETPVSLGGVGARVGYGSEFAFAKAFKREYGVAPGQYRRQRAARGGPAVPADPAALGRLAEDNGVDLAASISRSSATPE
jgi:AraC-like DNA-binding protein